MMVRIFMTCLALYVLVLLAAPAQAAENADTDGEPEQQAEEQAGQQQDGQAASDENGEPAEGQPSPTDQPIESDEENDGPQRFIPSEEISLDLGVSFPADI